MNSSFEQSTAKNSQVDEQWLFLVNLTAFLAVIWLFFSRVVKK
jgi:hypothetical protein